MDERNVELVRQIAKEVVYEVWDAEEGLVGSNKIAWTQTEGSSGPYERSEDVNNQSLKPC